MNFLAGMQALRQERQFSFIADVEDLPESVQHLMRAHPLEDTDGVNLNLFEYLRTDLDGPKTGARVPIPDTLVVKGGEVKAWYFWSPKEGRILKKRASNAHTRRYHESLARHPSAAFCAAYTVEEQPRLTDAGSRMVRLRYFDLEEARAMLGIHDPAPLYLGELIDRRGTLEETVQGPQQTGSDHDAFPRAGLVQRFLLPEVYADLPDANHTVKVRWTHTEGFSAARLACRRALSDRRQPRLLRVATWDTPDPKLVDVIPFTEGDPAVTLLEDATAKVLQHVARLTRGNKQIAYIELLFKLDRAGCPWLLFCPYLRLLRDDMLERQAHFGIAQPRPVLPPIYLLQGHWEDRQEEGQGEREVGPTDVFACVQCGAVHHVRHARQVPFRELQRYYETVVCFERDGRVRTWLEDQVPPSILRADPSISRNKYLRIKREVVFLYKMARCCEGCAEEVGRVTDRMLMAKKQPPAPFMRPSTLALPANTGPIQQQEWGLTLPGNLTVGTPGSESARQQMGSRGAGASGLAGSMKGVGSNLTLGAAGMKPSNSNSALNALDRSVSIIPPNPPTNASNRRASISMSVAGGGAATPGGPLSASIAPAVPPPYAAHPMSPMPLEVAMGPHAHRPQSSMLKLGRLDPSLVRQERERLADLEAQLQVAQTQGRKTVGAAGPSSNGATGAGGVSLEGTVNGRTANRDRDRAVLSVAVEAPRLGRLEALKAAAIPPERTEAARNIVILAATERVNERRRSRSPPAYAHARSHASPPRTSPYEGASSGPVVIASGGNSGNVGATRFREESMRPPSTIDEASTSFHPKQQQLRNTKPRGSWAGATAGRRPSGVPASGPYKPLFKPVSRRPSNAESILAAPPIIQAEVRVLKRDEQTAIVDRLYSAPGAGRRRETSHPDAKEKSEADARRFSPANAVMRAHQVYRAAQPAHEDTHPSAASPAPSAVSRRRSVASSAPSQRAGPSQSVRAGAVSVLGTPEGSSVAPSSPIAAAEEPVRPASGMGPRRALEDVLTSAEMDLLHSVVKAPDTEPSGELISKAPSMGRGTGAASRTSSRRLAAQTAAEPETPPPAAAAATVALSIESSAAAEPGANIPARTDTAADPESEQCCVAAPPAADSDPAAGAHDHAAPPAPAVYA